MSAYERGGNLPSTDILIKLAEVFDVTLDYLAFEANGGTGKLNIQDRELLLAFERMIERGLNDARSGRVISDDEMSHRIRTWQTSGTLRAITPRRPRAEEALNRLYSGP